MILEGRLGRELLGKKREPLDVETMKQVSRRAPIVKGRERMQRLVRNKPVYAPTFGEKKRAGQQREKQIQGKPGAPTQSAVGRPKASSASSDSSASSRTRTTRGGRGLTPNEAAARAVMAGAFSKASSVSGTAEYMAPEQIRGEPPKERDQYNKAVPKIRGGGRPHAARRQASLLARSVGSPRGSTGYVPCADSKGNQYTTARNCAPGHKQLSQRQKAVQPAIKRPAMPAPVRTTNAMRQAGARRARTRV